MDSQIEKIVADYDELSEQQIKLRPTLSPEERERRQDEFIIPIGRATGTLLNLLVKESNATRILDVGTSYGYSALWLGEAARQTGGRVISLEIHPAKQEKAKTAVRNAGLADWVEFRLGDARELITALDGPFDFVLIDLWKDLYIPCFDLIYPKLVPGALIAADNMLEPKQHREHAEAYRRHIRTKKGIESILLAVGSGVELSRYMG